MVNYIDLCDEVEKVFTTKHLEQYPTLEVPKPGHTLTASPLPPLDAQMHAILHRVALFCSTRAVVMKYLNN